MIAMFLVVHLIGPCQHEVDHPEPDLGLTAVSLVADDRVFSLQDGGMGNRSSRPAYCRALGSALSSPRLSTVTFSTLPRQILTQGTAIFSLNAQ